MIATLVAGAASVVAQQPQPAPEAAAVLPLQDRGRADQRDGDGHRSPAAGSSPICAKKTSAIFEDGSAADHALQQRARAGQPRDRARHERQHGRREDGGRARGAAALPVRPARPRGRSVPLSIRQPRRSWSKAGRAIGSGSAGRLDRLVARGGTALYDAVAEAVPLAQTGRHRKKALVIISDGNDTSSHTTVAGVKQRSARPRCWSTRSASTARAVTATVRRRTRAAPAAAHRQSRFRCPSPRPPATAVLPAPPRSAAGRIRRSDADERVNVAALRDITDDSGGRTEIVRAGARSRSRDSRDIADELSQQYSTRLSVDREEGRTLAPSIPVEVRGGLA